MTKTKPTKKTADKRPAKKSAKTASTAGKASTARKASTSRKASTARKASTSRKASTARKASRTRTKTLVRGRIVKAEAKGLRKHTLKKTGEEIRFKKSRHPENRDAHALHVHGKLVEGGLQLVTPAAQKSITASLRAREDVAAGSLITFATAREFAGA